MNLGELIGRNRTAILGLTVLLSVTGLWAASTLPFAIFPEVAFHRVNLIAHAGEMPIPQTATAVTRPLEDAMSSVLGVELIRSTTSRGGAQLELSLRWDQDPLQVLQLVQAAMEETRATLPAATELEARLLDTSAFPTVGIAVTSPAATLATMSDFVLYEAAPQLRTIPGVYRVELSGAKIREYSLTVDPIKLGQHRLDLDTVARAVRESNVVAAGGRVEDGYHLALTVVRGEGAQPNGLLDVIVGQNDSVPVRLGDVATLEATVREDFTRASADGETAVLIGISRQPTGDAVAMSQGIRERVDALARVHPEYRFNVFYDQADLVREAVGSVRDSIAVGLLLAVATIFFFIGDRRMTVVAAAVIPTTVLLTCIVLRALGMTFNLMTLGGIAAGIGLILDDAIVVVENYQRHRLQGEAPALALKTSVSEITHALLGSTLTPVAVLLPLGLLGGVPGAFFLPLALTMSVALLISLVLALSFTPALAAVVDDPKHPAAGRGYGDRLTAWLVRGYAPGLSWALRHRWVPALVVAALIGIAAWAYRSLDTGFVPEMDEGAFILDYWTPPGSSIDATLAMLTRVDAILHAVPEVRSFSRRTGSELGFFLTEANRGDYTVLLRTDRERDIEAIMDEVREAIHAGVPGVRIDFVQMMQDMIGDLSGNPSPIEIKLFGVNEAALQQAARKVAALIAAVPGVVDDFDGITEVGPTYEIAVDERHARLVGLSADAVQRWAETAITGTVVGQVLEGDRAIPLRLRYPDTSRNDLAALRRLDLITPQGDAVALQSVAHLGAGGTAVQATRENLRQYIPVTARLHDRDLGSVMRDIQTTLSRNLSLPGGVSLEYGGMYLNQTQAFSELLLVLGAALACVLALLLVEFGSIAAALAIVIGSSLALAGSVLALWVTRTSLNVSSIVGMIMAVGIVAKNGILLLDVARREVAHTGNLEDALVLAGGIRLRPILMTSLAAAAGMAPLALGLGAGSQMQQPLAIAILGGVGLSMFFSLFAVPLVYQVLTRQPAGLEPHAPADR